MFGIGWNQLTSQFAMHIEKVRKQVQAKGDGTPAGTACSIHFGHDQGVVDSKYRSVRSQYSMMLIDRPSTEIH